MNNSEYLEMCLENNIKEPNVAGFYFPIPIPYPTHIEPNRDPIYSCCYYCAKYYYFELDPTEIQKEYERDPEFAEFIQEEHKALRLTKDIFNSAIMISFVDPDQISQVFTDGFVCFMCNSVAVY